MKIADVSVNDEIVATTLIDFIGFLSNSATTVEQLEFYADRLQLFKDLPQSKQDEFVMRLFDSVRNNLYAFMLSITSVDAMKVKQSGVEHELTILHHQMWETVREAMKPGLYFIADCQ